MFWEIKNGVKKCLNKLPSAYPSSRVTYKQTNVESELDEITSNLANNFMYVSKYVNGLSIDTAWGGIYTAIETVDISSLNLSATPEVISVVYEQATGGTAIPTINTRSTTAITVSLSRGTSATVSGFINLLLRKV